MSNNYIYTLPYRGFAAQCVQYTTVRRYCGARVKARVNRTCIHHTCHRYGVTGDRCSMTQVTAVWPCHTLILASPLIRHNTSILCLCGWSWSLGSLAAIYEKPSMQIVLLSNTNSVALSISWQPYKTMYWVSSSRCASQHISFCDRHWYHRHRTSFLILTHYCQYTCCFNWVSVAMVSGMQHAKICLIHTHPLYTATKNRNV